MSDTGPRGVDKLNILGIVTVGVCGAVLTYVSIVLLEAFYMTETSEIERQRAFEAPASLRNTVKAAHLTNLNGDKEGTIAIDRAMELIVAEAANDPSNLVPAVGASKTPSVLPEYGRPGPVPTAAPATPPPAEPAPAPAPATEPAPAPAEPKTETAPAAPAPKTETVAPDTKPAAPATKPAPRKPAAPKTQTPPATKPPAAPAGGNAP